MQKNRRKIAHTQILRRVCYFLETAAGDTLNLRKDGSKNVNTVLSCKQTSAVGGVKDSEGKCLSPQLLKFYLFITDIVLIPVRIA